MKEECLICKSSLKYLKFDKVMECAICHKKENSKTSCIKNHYVCNECHTKGIDSIINLCLKEKSKNPITIIQKIMDKPFCHTHGPEHHIIVGVSLLTAYKNAGGKIKLYESIVEMIHRGKSVPGGACGFWGACGAAISSGMFISIISKSTPLENKPFSLSNIMTSKSLNSIGTVGGPRCCKRNSFLSIIECIKFVKENFNINMGISNIICKYSSKNNQCIKQRCPFYNISTKK